MKRLQEAGAVQVKPDVAGSIQLPGCLWECWRNHRPVSKRREKLVEEGERYARLTGHPIQYQLTLLEGGNAGDEIDCIVELLRGKYAVLNMIPYNTNPGLPFRRPAWEKAREIAAELHRRGVLTKLRDSAGQDVDGGCGQLRARTAYVPIVVATR